MCIKKVACGLQKVKKEDGREVLEPIFVEVDCPSDMHRITSKIDSCKTVVPKINHEVEVLPVTVQNEQEGGRFPLTVENEHDGDHGGHGGVIDNVSPITDNVSPITDNVSPIGGKVSTDNKEVTTDNKEVTTGNKKEVVCVETGEIFSSIRQASKSINVDFSNIAKCCKGKLKTAGGYHWKYV